MARIPREIVEAIRDRTEIVEVVSRHVQLQRRGNSWVGLCPFHQEKTPSFHVVPSKAMYHCFGCHASGDVFRFLAEIEGLSFVEAVKELAGPAGVTIEERELSREERDNLRKRATLYDVLEEAATFFEAQLWTGPEGEQARAYLQRRDLSAELAREARVGWAPEGWTRTLDHLQRKGFPTGLVVEAGLAKPRPGGDGSYDAFRARVILPIRDDRGRVIAFGGRLLEGDGPKYINSPETKLYQKSHVLYGLDAARRAVGQADRVILVEGYFDVLSMHQAGFRETVATCGTSLTPEHVAKLRRLTRTVVVLLDADEAGTRAAERTLPLLEQAGIQGLRLQIPDAKDPDDLLREQGAEAMAGLLARAEPLLAWVAARKVAAYGLTAAGKARARDELAEMLHGLTPGQVAELAPVLRIHEGELLAWARAHAHRAPDEAPRPEPRAGWRPHVDAVHLLWLLVHRAEEVGDLVRRVDPGLIATDAVLARLVSRLLQGETLAAVLDDEEDPGVMRALAAIAARSALYAPDEAARAVVEVLARMARPQWDEELALATADAADAARARDFDRARAASTRKHVVSLRRRSLDRALDTADLELAITLLEPDDEPADALP
ncbi:MAG: DNA primase [Alphaproteobacteria bacterium]|nr:DNA primase [Alphaproteobacteria bacterium]